MLGPAGVEKIQGMAGERGTGSEVAGGKVDKYAMTLPITGGSSNEGSSCFYPGKVKKKVAPFPSSPSPHTSPPWRCMIRRTVVNPIPVPGKALAFWSR